MILDRKRKKPRRLAASPFVNRTTAVVPQLDELVGMFIPVDLSAHVVRFMIQLPLIFLGEVPVVGSHVLLFVVLQPLLASFEVSRLSRRQSSTLYTVGDPVLLVLFPPVDLIDARVPRIILPRTCAGSVAVLGLSSSRSHNDQTAHCQHGKIMF